MRPASFFLKTSVTRLGDFECSWLQIYQQKQSKYMEFFQATVKSITFSIKTAVAPFWSTFVKFGLFFILTSGHTGEDVLQVSCERLHSIMNDCHCIEYVVGTCSQRTLTIGGRITSKKCCYLCVVRQLNPLQLNWRPAIQ